MKRRSSTVRLGLVQTRCSPDPDANLKNTLQAAGTSSVGSTGSPVTSIDSTGGAGVVKHNFFSADLDVVAADSTIGKTVHVDVHGEYGEPSCHAWGIAIPSS